MVTGSTHDERGFRKTEGPAFHDALVRRLNQKVLSRVDARSAGTRPTTPGRRRAHGGDRLRLHRPGRPARGALWPGPMASRSACLRLITHLAF